VRHADAGYETARETARKNGIKMPMDGTAIEDGRSKMES
jgi:urocanate hydratase